MAHKNPWSDITSIQISRYFLEEATFKRVDGARCSHCTSSPKGMVRFWTCYKAVANVFPNKAEPSCTTRTGQYLLDCWYLTSLLNGGRHWLRFWPYSLVLWGFSWPKRLQLWCSFLSCRQPPSYLCFVFREGKLRATLADLKSDKKISSSLKEICV